MANKARMADEAVSAHDVHGERFWSARVTDGGGGDTFVGIVADRPLGEIQFDDNDDAAEGMVGHSLDKGKGTEGKGGEGRGREGRGVGPDDSWLARLSSHPDVVLSALVFGTRDANILDEVSPAAQAAFWIGFNVFVVAMLGVDFLCTDQKEGRTNIRSAAVWTLLWVCLAVWFDGLLWAAHGRAPALVWLTSYLLGTCWSIGGVCIIAAPLPPLRNVTSRNPPAPTEKFLSVDNLFVFLYVVCGTID
jgi:hypothetical protein